MHPVEGCREFDFVGGMWQEITGKLLCEKLIVLHVGVESLDYPIAIGPGWRHLIALVAVGVGVTRHL